MVAQDPGQDRREALRGAEEETFDLLSEVLASAEWAALLKAPLERAAKKGNRGLAQKLVGAGAEMGKALHEAVLGGHEGIANDLLESGASTDARDDDGRTPLHLAAHGGKSDIVSLLMLKGAEKDAMDGSDRTPLYLAVRRGQVSTTLALLVAGADVHLRCRSCKEKVVHAAIRIRRVHNNVEILRAVIEHGADLEAAGVGGYTPLHFAAEYKRVELIDVLVDAGVNIEARVISTGDTPLHIAAAGWGRLDAVLALLKHGVDINSHNYKHQTPLHCCTMKLARRDYCAALVEIGPDCCVEFVDSLLRAGADETILNHRGEAAVDVINTVLINTDLEEQEGNLVEAANRMRELLANAPADRAWRRRGYLVLCRAHPDRVQLLQESGGVPADVARTTPNAPELARSTAGDGNGTAGGGTADERTNGDWVGLAAMVLELQEAGIFRTIVGYL